MRGGGTRGPWSMGLVLSLVGSLALAGTAQGASFPVTNTNDAGGGSLRQAILDANGAAGADTIPISATGTVNLATALPAITEQLTISGPGAAQFTINGGSTVRPLQVSNVAVSISGLTVANGRATIEGGGLRAGGANVALTLRDCVFRDNQVVGAPVVFPEAFASGGAIFTEGPATIRDCTFAGNRATAVSDVGTADNSAAATGGAIHALEDPLDIERATFSDNAATVTGGDEVVDALGGALRIVNSRLTNVTVTGNTASIVTGAAGSKFTRGGGIWMDRSTLRSVTVADNTVVESPGAPTGANIYVLDGGAPSSFLQNTLIANPLGAANCDLQNPADPISLGNNLVTDTSCGGPAATDLIGVNPSLKPLADNGGSTQTRALPVDSPAVDQGASDGLKDDQRGLPRPSETLSPNNPAGGDGADIGAYELQAPDTRMRKKPLIQRPKKSILRFRSTIAGSTFTCTLDGGKPKGCKNPRNYRFLKKGEHTFSVFATSPEGVQDPTPAEVSWFVKKNPRPPGRD